MGKRIPAGISHAIIANVLWGTTFLATQHALTVWSPITATIIRFALAFLVLAAGMKGLAQPIGLPRTPAGWRALLATSVLGFGLLYPLQATGLKTISSGASAILMLTAPLFLISISAFRGESISRSKWVGVITGMIGGGVLIGTRTATGGTEIDLPGAALTLCASMCLASSTITAKRALAEIDQLSLTLLSMGIGSLILIPGGLIEAQPLAQSTTSAWLAIAYLASICSILSFSLWNKAIAIGSPALIASTMHIKTPVAVILGMALNREPLSLPICVGGALVAIGVGIATAAKPKRRTSQ